MVKKLLNPIVVCGFITVVLLGSLAHLCYGSSQTSKHHYIVQDHYIIKYFPVWMLSKLSKEKTQKVLFEARKNNKGGKPLKRFDYLSDVDYLKSTNYSGHWTEWHLNGIKRHVGKYQNGKLISFDYWDDKGIELIDPFYFMCR